MALRQTVLNYQRRERTSILEALRETAKTLVARSDDLKKREAELESDIESMPADADEETKTAVEKAVEDLTAEMDAVKKETEANAAEIAKVEAEVEAIDEEIKAITETPPAPPADPAPTETNNRNNERSFAKMEKRHLRDMSSAEIREFRESEVVKAFTRDIKYLASRTNAGNVENHQLTVPTKILPILRGLIEDNSVMLKHIHSPYVPGEGKVTIAPDNMEAQWMDAFGDFPELSMALYGTTFGAHLIGGLLPVNNFVLKDSYENLAELILEKLARAEGRGIDKAWAFGTGVNMPLGVATRIMQTAAPEGYGATELPWENLSATNAISISAANSTGVKLFQSISEALKVIKNDYQFKNGVAVMNRSTKQSLITQSIGANASAAIVAGLTDSIPGGADFKYETLACVPDDIMIVGYADSYEMPERDGVVVDSNSSERFSKNQTLFRGYARYDGKPLIPNAWAIIAINGANIAEKLATVTFTGQA